MNGKSAGLGERPDEPVLDNRPDKWDNTVVTNPTPFIIENNEIFLIYCSDTPKGLRLGIAKADSIGDKFVRISDELVFHFDEKRFCDDLFVWWNSERYEVIMKDLTGNITGEWHAGVHEYSDDDIHWQIAEPPKAFSRTVVWSNCDTTSLGSFERHQLLIDKKSEPTHLFAATANGPGCFRNATQTWCMVRPLKKITITNKS